MGPMKRRRGDEMAVRRRGDERAVRRRGLYGMDARDQMVIADPAGVRGCHASDFGAVAGPYAP